MPLVRCFAGFALLGLFANSLVAQEKKTTPFLALAAFERFHADAPDARAGQLLLGELNCLSCHQPDASLQKIVAKKMAPNLESVGSRIHPEYLLKFLKDPATVKPGTTMPHLALADDHIEAIAHYLSSTGSLKAEAPDKKLVKSGQDLYSKVGCVACHGVRDAKAKADYSKPVPIPLAGFKEKYTIPSLKAFLENPHQTRPSGRMPGLLQAKEAQEMAHYLLQDAETKGLPANLNYTYYEGNFAKVPDFAKLKAKDEGKARGFDVTVGRKENIALRFQGFFDVAKPGNYKFDVSSDDGSLLWVDGNLVVSHDGVHAPSTKSGKLQLDPGVHEVIVGYFNGTAGAELSVEVTGPDKGKHNLATIVRDTREPMKVALGTAGFQLNPELAAKGRSLFVSVGCNNCHQVKDPAKQKKLPAPAFAKAKLDAGCLALTPSKNAPKYPLSEPMRVALKKALSSPANEPGPAEQIERTLVTFNCYACHERGKIGGPEEKLNVHFLTTQPEMGDEGRIPPSLNGVGAKLNKEYTRKILDQGAHDRPYMHTRMPKFGNGNVGHLVELFASLDKLPAIAPVTFSQPMGKVKAEARHMVGAFALGCIKCHTFAGNKAEGVQGIDMTLMPQRLQRDWFLSYLLDPNKFRPGTRMPTAWPKGETPFTNILDGKTDQQVEAIWVYLGDGAKSQLPIGLKKESIPLFPIGDAILYRNFLQGAGARAIGVGFPEKVSLAFDANDLRLALVWQGAFMDAAKHWTARGVGFESPLGDNVLSLPPGASFATLAKDNDAWPAQSAKDLGQKFKGYRLSPDQRPTFLYAVGDVLVEDTPNALPIKDAAMLKRSLVFSSETPPKGLSMRLAIADKITPLEQGWYAVGKEYKVRVDGDARIREVAGKTELIAPIRFEKGRATLGLEYHW